MDMTSMRYVCFNELLAGGYFVFLTVNYTLRNTVVSVRPPGYGCDVIHDLKHRVNRPRQLLALSWTQVQLNLATAFDKR
jgi:hypothetical protein